MGRWYIKSILSNRFLNWNKIFEKIVTGNTSFFKIGSFCSPCYLSWHCLLMTVLCRNDVFSILVPSTNKRYFSFLQKVFVSRKCFKVKVLKTFKIKHADTSNGGLFWKSLVPFFITYALPVGVKMKPLRSVFQC